MLCQCHACLNVLCPAASPVGAWAVLIADRHGDCRWRSEAARKAQKRLAGTIAVVSASTADPRVAEECRAVADAVGCAPFDCLRAILPLACSSLLYLAQLLQGCMLKALWVSLCWLLYMFVHACCDDVMHVSSCTFVMLAAICLLTAASTGVMPSVCLRFQWPSWMAFWGMLAPCALLQ